MTLPRTRPHTGRVTGMSRCVGGTGPAGAAGGHVIVRCSPGAAGPSGRPRRGVVAGQVGDRGWRGTMCRVSDRKTRPTTESVDEFLAGVEPAGRRADTEEVAELVGDVTGVEPVMWGTIVGYGTQTYTTADGKEHETFVVGLAPRKAALTLYGLTYYGSNTDLLADLGPHTTGKGCLYLKRLDGVDRDVLRALVERAWSEQTDGGKKS